MTSATAANFSSSQPVVTATPASTANGSGGRIATLDGLRGCAVLLVLVHHYIGMSPMLAGPPGAAQSYLRALLGLTPTGVDLFFVLSGFLIGGILLDHRDSPRLMRAFYARRFLRIVPVAWLCIGLSLVLSWLAGETASPAIPWWVGLTFTTNLFLAAANGWVLSPLTAHWSLAIEEQFYVLFPWVVRGWPRALLGWLGPMLIIGALAARVLIVAFAPQYQFACSVLTFCRLDSFGAGFTVAWLLRASVWRRLQRRRTWLWLSLAISALGPAILLKQQYRAPSLLTSWGYTSIALFYGLALVLAIDPPERWLRRVFEAAWLTVYGRLSYFIYLFQLLLAAPLVSMMFHGHWRNAPLSTWPENFAAIVLMLLPAALSWNLLEAPLLRVGRRWSYD